MSKLFDGLFDRLMKNEGGYVNNPSDPGGETMWGVTKTVARQFGYTGAMRQLPKATAQQIADKLYWQAVQGDRLDRAIAWQLLDAAYNHGNRNAVRMLQRAVGVPDDGVIGNQTLSAISAIDKNDVLLKFNAERIEFFTSLGTFGVFGKGWMRRVATNLRWAATDN